MQFMKCFLFELTGRNSAQIGVGCCIVGREVGKCIERFGRSSRAGEAC